MVVYPSTPHLQLVTGRIRAALHHLYNVCFTPIRAAQSAAQTAPDKDYAATAVSTWESHFLLMPVMPVAA